MTHPQKIYFGVSHVYLLINIDNLIFLEVEALTQSRT